VVESQQLGQGGELYENSRLTDNIHEVFPHGRFTTRQPDLLDTVLDEQTSDSFDLVGRE
jgi:hypothetical protein